MGTKHGRVNVCVCGKCKFSISIEDAEETGGKKREQDEAFPELQLLFPCIQCLRLVVENMIAFPFFSPQKQRPFHKKSCWPVVEVECEGEFVTFGAFLLRVMSLREWKLMF